MPSPRAVILNNTIYANGDWGIEIGNQHAGVARRRGGEQHRLAQRRRHQGHRRAQRGQRHDADPATVGVRLRRRLQCACSMRMARRHAASTRIDFHVDPLFVIRRARTACSVASAWRAAFVDRSADDDFHLRQLGAGQPGGRRRIGARPPSSVSAARRPATAAPIRARRHRLPLRRQRRADADAVTAPFMPLYVRTAAATTCNGRSPEQRRSARLQPPAARAAGGITVVVGPGRYRGVRSVLARQPRQGRPSSPIRRGAQTGDAARRPVMVDASQCHFDDVNQVSGPGETAFDLSSTCDAVIDGFHVTGAKEDGIRVDDQSRRRDDPQQCHVRHRPGQCRFRSAARHARRSTARK